jgi:hypothetical protein
MPRFAPAAGAIALSFDVVAEDDPATPAGAAPGEPVLAPAPAPPTAAAIDLAGATLPPFTAVILAVAACMVAGWVLSLVPDDASGVPDADEHAPSEHPPNAIQIKYVLVTRLMRDKASSDTAQMRENTGRSPASTQTLPSARKPRARTTTHGRWCAGPSGASDEPAKTLAAEGYSHVIVQRDGAPNARAPPSGYRSALEIDV